MLVFDRACLKRLTDYGIQVPIIDSRVEKTLESIDSKFLYQGAWEEFHKEDALRVHDPSFVSEVFDGDPTERLIQAYELRDAHGKWQRYVPQDAIKPLRDFRENIFWNIKGTLTAMRLALDCEAAFFFGGGMHHALYEKGQGFCLFNDIVIGLRSLQARGKIKTAWVIDIDAHKGDGTSSITYSDKSIATLSIHMAKGWPLEELHKIHHPSYIPSDVEIPIEEKEEHLYLGKLSKGLSELEELYPNPDLAIVVAGADPYEKDVLPGTSFLKLTKQQMLERDKIVFNFLKQRQIPQAYVMAGGYGPEIWEIYAQFLNKVFLPNLRH